LCTQRGLAIGIQRAKQITPRGAIFVGSSPARQEDEVDD